MTERPQILVVEDDKRLANLMRDYLQAQGYAVSIEGRGDRAPHRILDENPELVILDLMLPGLDGLSVCQEVRSRFSGPILILTAREDDMDQVAGLELGADDYVKKPVQPRVLLARIRALFRRFQKTPVSGESLEELGTSSDLKFGSLRISRASRNVHLNGQMVELTTNEFELLWILASHCGQILDRDAILERLRGIDYDGLDRSVDISVSRLRKKLGDNPKQPRRIKTVWGRGYLFVKDAW